MQGVTIVSSEPIMNSPTWLWAMIIFGIVFAFLFLMFAIISLEHDWYILKNIFLIFMICSFLTFIVGGFMRVSGCFDVYDHTKYFVKVSDETPLLEFNEKYEVLEQHGDLWEVKEIQEDN